MFARLPDILGRNFAIGYLLPALFFVLATYLIDSKYVFLPKFLNYSSLSQLEILELITVISLASILIGIILLILNGAVIRVMEGYGKFNPFKLLSWIEKYRFDKIEKDISKTEDVYNNYLEQKKEVPQKIKQKYKDLIEKRAIRFPDSKRWLLPTSFGNTIRAFETYSRVMYGADAIAIWSRLLAVIPENYRQFIEGAKAQVDFWVNFWLVNIILLTIYTVNLIYLKQIKIRLFPIVCLFFIFFSFQQARKSAVGWGNFVKSSFDLFLPDLENKLKISQIENNMTNQSNLWKKYSQAFLYIIPDVLPNKKQIGENESNKLFIISWVKKSIFNRLK